MSHRPDLNSLSAASRASLVAKMQAYINDAIVWAHNPDNPNAIVHHMGEHAFITHRNYIGDMEAWLTTHGGAAFVPLPAWNPANPIPAEFNVVEPQDDGTPRPPLVNLNPSLGKPAGLVPPPLCGIGDADSLWDVNVDSWHGSVHWTIGGTMGDIHIAPAAPIFFNWHAYVDEIYDDWLRCHWSGWEDLGGIITSGVGVASWAANRLDCFAKGQNNHMWHKWWNGSAWSGWEDLGGVIDDTPAAVSWGPNRIDCFVRGMDNHMYHKWFDGSWHGWEDLGGIILSGPAVASWASGRLDCFARGQNGHMWHKWFDGSWHSWEDLGGVIDGTPAAVSWGANRIDCFARGMNNHMWHKWWNGAWSGWQDLGGIITAGPGAASRFPNGLDTFVKGGDNSLWYRWVDRSIVHGHAGTWSGWHKLGGIFDDEPGAVSWGPNRLDVFVRGANNHMYHKWWQL
jgi:Common central domain of tyrosinase/Repeat of unknown function (DUF346)